MRLQLRGGGRDTPESAMAGLQQPNFTRQPQPPLSQVRLGALRFELAVFLLLVATFAAVLFKEAIVDRRISISPSSVSRFERYWYSDATSGGKSAIAGDAQDPLGWTCDLRAGFAYPFCGFGILFDAEHNGHGRDLSGFQAVTIDLDYHGPGRQLKIVLKNSDPRYADPAAGDSTKPNVLEFPVAPGSNHVALNLSDAAVEQWWSTLHKKVPGAGQPQFGNIVAVDVLTGSGAPPGRYDFRLRTLTLSGSSVTPEHWYLIILGCWTGFSALFLVYRFFGMKRQFAARQQALLVEQGLLQDARDAAESASHAKSRFLAHMSHELRTPLNAILGYAQLLKASELPPERRAAAAGTIQQSGEHLLSLITDILDLSKIEAGKLDLAPAPIDLRATVRGVANMIAVRAQEKDLLFHWAIAPDVPAGVVADAKLLRQVLINLLGNAVKFTDRGEIRLQVGLVESGGGDVRVRFDVRDTGSGMASDVLKTVFEPFEQVGDTAKRAGGTGLGLSISQRIVQLMGDQIEVESTPGVGSRFWFALTLPLADCKTLPGTDQETSSSDVHRPRIAFSAAPSPAQRDRLLELARAGSMREIKEEAEHLMASDHNLSGFCGELLVLTRGFRTRAILELIENQK